MSKDKLYIDLDGVVVDYHGSTHPTKKGAGFFRGLQPIEGAIAAVKRLSRFYDVYFLSTAPWSNVHAWMEKREWVEEHFGEVAFKRLILTHNKGLLRGEYLIDDRIANGVEDFQGEHLHFGTTNWPDWASIEKYLCAKVYAPTYIQKKVSDPENKISGSCMRTALACVTHTDPEGWPHLEDMGREWHMPFINHLMAVGFDYEGTCYRHKDESVEEFWERLTSLSPGVNGYYVVNGVSPRAHVTRAHVTRGHSVVYKDGELYHDPFPYGTGLVEVQSAYMIEHLDYSRSYAPQK